MDELISVAEAQERISRHMPAFGSERVALDRATGRVLRQSVHAERDQPPFDRVMMDGIAIAAGHPSPRSLVPAALQMAGMARQQLDAPDHCIEVSTGAMLPRGADTVIPIEQTRRDGQRFVLAEASPPSRISHFDAELAAFGFLCTPHSCRRRKATWGEGSPHFNSRI